MAMTLRLSEDDDKLLSASARRLEVSKQEAATQAIRDQAARLAGASDVQQWVDHALVRYEALLDRLAQ